MMLSRELAEKLSKLGIEGEDENRMFWQDSYTLSQLLEEVEKHFPKMDCEIGKLWWANLYGDQDGWSCEVMSLTADSDEIATVADTPEDAVALALIEIVENQ